MGKVIVKMSAEACGARAKQMDDRADLCFSEEAGDMYREVADQWRHLRAEAIEQDALSQVQTGGKRRAQGS